MKAYFKLQELRDVYDEPPLPGLQPRWGWLPTLLAWDHMRAAGLEPEETPWYIAGGAIRFYPEILEAPPEKWHELMIGLTPSAEEKEVERWFSSLTKEEKSRFPDLSWEKMGQWLDEGIAAIEITDAREIVGYTLPSALVEDRRQYLFVLRTNALLAFLDEHVYPFSKRLDDGVQVWIFAPEDSRPIWIRPRGDPVLRKFLFVRGLRREVVEVIAEAVNILCQRDIGSD